MVVGGPGGHGIRGGTALGPEPDRTGSTRNGEDWRALGPAAQTAYAEGFLAGSAFGQAVAAASDSAG